MVQKMLTPQSVELHYVLPAIRRELAKAMKELDMGQNEIAHKLSVTGAAVSQYINDKRACKTQLNKSIRQAVKESAKKIKDGGFLLEETQKLLRLVKTEKITCSVCKKEGNVPKGCEVCFKCGYI